MAAKSISNEELFVSILILRTLFNPFTTQYCDRYVNLSTPTSLRWRDRSESVDVVVMSEVFCCHVVVELYIVRLQHRHVSPDCTSYGIWQSSLLFCSSLKRFPIWPRNNLYGMLSCLRWFFFLQKKKKKILWSFKVNINDTHNLNTNWWLIVYICV